MRYKSIPNTLFKKNREKFAGGIDDNSFAYLLAADQMPRNGDLFYPYRQNSDFFYLTGIEQEHSRLIIRKKAGIVKASLFILEPDKKTETWEGKKLTVGEARDISGIDDVRYLDEADVLFGSCMETYSCIYLNKNENPRFSSEVKTSDIQLIESVKQDFPQHEIKSTAPVLNSIRTIKDDEEIQIIQQACNITANAFDRILGIVKPGMYEYEVEAELTYEYMKNGANGHAFEPIVASGVNSCYLHYIKNDAILKEGDVLLMDFGAEYANYASDCSRTIPVSGTFSPRQKQVYNAVLRIMKQAISLIKPGTAIIKYHKTISAFVEEECISLGLFTKEAVKKQDPRNPLFFKYFMHGISHFMGIDTHDSGDKTVELKPGMIVTCEPGIYIPEEEIGIRLENDILITEDGNIDLMGNMPIEADEIESLMKQKK